MFIKLLTLSNVPPQRSLGLAYGQSRREGACKIQMERRGGKTSQLKYEMCFLDVSSITSSLTCFVQLLQTLAAVLEFFRAGMSRWREEAAVQGLILALLLNSSLIRSNSYLFWKSV